MHKGKQLDGLWRSLTDLSQKSNQQYTVKWRQLKEELVCFNKIVHLNKMLNSNSSPIKLNEFQQLDLQKGEIEALENRTRPFYRNIAEFRNLKPIKPSGNFLIEQRPKATFASLLHQAINSA